MLLLFLILFFFSFTFLGLLGCGERKLDRVIVRQCYEFIEMAGPRGLSQVAVGQLAGLPSLQARSVCKYMVKNKMCGIAFADMGRQRVSQLVILILFMLFSIFRL